MKQVKDLKVGDILYYVYSTYCLGILKVSEITVSLKNTRYKIKMQDIRNNLLFDTMYLNKDQTEAHTDLGTVYINHKDVKDLLEKIKEEVEDALQMISQRKARNIEWDTDNDDNIYLPAEVDIPIGIEDDRIADYLSDKYGFLVSSFELKK